jgi:hypothetical protein
MRAWLLTLVTGACNLISRSHQIMLFFLWKELPEGIRRRGNIVVRLLQVAQPSPVPTGLNQFPTTSGILKYLCNESAGVFPRDKLGTKERLLAMSLRYHVWPGCDGYRCVEHR